MLFMGSPGTPHFQDNFAPVIGCLRLSHEVVDIFAPVLGEDRSQGLLLEWAGQCRQIASFCVCVYQHQDPGQRGWIDIDSRSDMIRPVD